MAGSNRQIALGQGLPKIPEELLLAHAQGRTLFICGAGVSRPAGLPDFRKLVLDVYASLDAPVHEVLEGIPNEACNQWQPNSRGLNDKQVAEIRRFIARDYDVVLGLLERRLEGEGAAASRVRQRVEEILRQGAQKPAAIHRSLIRLADRGEASAIVTTNFDLLFESAAKRIGTSLESSALGSIPRPTYRAEFSGVLHIHGALSLRANRHSELVLSDEDFGECYLRRRIVPDFIYDAARLFNLVLVGYSANDPPMRYLLNAVAADGNRFSDLKNRFVFIGGNAEDSVALEDWKGRGIIPIPYDDADNHQALAATLDRWSKLSAVNGKVNAVHAELRRIAKTSRQNAHQDDLHLFDHLIRRSNAAEREAHATFVSSRKADISWLDAIMRIAREPKQS